MAEEWNQRCLSQGEEPYGVCGYKSLGALYLFHSQSSFFMRHPHPHATDSLMETDKVWKGVLSGMVTPISCCLPALLLSRLAPPQGPGMTCWHLTGVHEHTCKSDMCSRYII